MKAWLLNEIGGLDHLHLGETADPFPGPGEVVLDVEFAALNPADRYLAEGQYPAKPTFPHILGRDGVGIVSAKADDVRDIQIGRRLLILRGETGVNRRGTFAQRVAVATHSLAELPIGWTRQESASASLVYLTAHQALTQWADLPLSSVVLVTGASGGVGVACVQLGKAIGHTVIGLSRSKEKQHQLREIGAHDALDPQNANWRKELKEMLSPRKVDLIIDNIGGALLPDVMETLGNLGRVSIVGRLAGPVPQFNTASMIFRRLKIGGVAVGSYTPSEARETWTDIVALLHETGAKPLIDRVFPFDQLPAAFEHLARGPMGKVLLQV
jgi:NADPH2:quinone reductase